MVPIARAALACVLALAPLLAGAAPQAVVAVAGGTGERALYDLARSLSERSGKGFAGAALEELKRYDRLYPDGSYLDDVHYRMARAELALGHEHAAAFRLLEVRIVDAASLREGPAGEELDKLLGGHGLRDLRERYQRAIERYRDESAPPSDRRVRFLRAALLIDDPEAAELVAAEASAYLERAGADDDALEVALALGEIERRHGEPERAVAAYERVRFFQPQSRLVPRALLATGRILEEDLGDLPGALRAYEDVARGWEQSSEAATAWLRMGEVERRGLKRPEIAVRDFDEVLKRYPEHPDAFAAVLARGETLAGPLSDPEGAEKGLLAGVERYPSHPQAPEALEEAGRVAEKGLKEPARAAAHYQRLAERYPAYAGSPQALFHAAELLEEIGEPDRALSLYRATAQQFPSSPQAARATKRATRLERRAGS